MIVKMTKVYVAARGDSRDRLLDALRNLGVLHLAPVDPGRAVPDEQTVSAIESLGRALQILTVIQPAGPAPQTSALDAAGEVLQIQRDSAERKSRLNALRRQLDQLAMWGDVRLEQFEQLKQAGIDVRIFIVPPNDLQEIRAECVKVIGKTPGGDALVATVDRTGALRLPESAKPLDLPERDRPAIRAEATKIDQELKGHAERLSQLAKLAEAMRNERRALAEKAAYTVAQRGALSEAGLFAIQGWTPQEEAGTLSERLAAAGVTAAVHRMPPAEDDEPPTLIRYPGWARPIKGLFDILATLPGYREFDIAPFFMIALPLFAAMIIGDAGYGLLLTVLPLVFYGKFAEKVGKAKVQLLIIFGVATLIWGLLAGNMFGIMPKDLVAAGGLLAMAGGVLEKLQVIRGTLNEQAQTIMKISFVIGTVHLSTAHLRRALALAPDARALSSVGWAGFLWGMLGVVWFLFFSSQAEPPQPIHPAVPYLLGIGAALAILFESSSRNPIKRLGVGLVNFPLTAIGTFSDTLSYIRLMAIGLASTIIGQTFNGLAAQAASAASWFMAVPILLLGHSLNLAMCMIAILAHGVRLNMLEFANNAGIQWAGYPYEPFAAIELKEN